MEIKRGGPQPSGKGPEAYFTGAVRIDAPFSGAELRDEPYRHRGIARRQGRGLAGEGDR